MSLNAGLIKQADFEYFGLVQLPEIHSSTTFPYVLPIVGTQLIKPFPQYELCYYYARGQNTPMRWLSLEDYMIDTTNFSVYYGSDEWNRIYNILFTNRTESEVESDTYIEAQEIFRANTRFLYGSFDEASGLYLVKSSSNTFRIRLLNGFYQYTNPDTEEVTYYYNDNMPSSHNFTIAELSSVYFCWAGDENSAISMFSMPIDELNARFKWTIGYNTPDIEGGFRYLGWNEVTGAEASSYLGWNTLTKWDTSLEFVSYPIYPFRPMQSPENNISLYNWYNYTVPASTLRLTGSDLEEFNQDNIDTSGTSDTGGGGGDYPTTSDECKDPDATDLNTVNVVNSGLVTLYRPTMGGLQSFSNFLFTGITDAIADQLKKLLANPLDYVLFCSLCKFTPTVSTAQEISFCGIGTGVSSDVIPNQFHTLDCGSILLPESSETFMDYAPHSKVQLYLPYCGIHELNADDVMGGIVHIKYNIDMLSGSCVASVEVKRSARGNTDASIDTSLYKFNGNCYLTMPLSATDWRGAYNSMVQFAGGIVATAGGNPMAGVGAMASAVTQQKVSVGRSGQGGSNYGHMSDGKPYFILSRPTPSIPYNFNGFEGYKSNIRYNVGQLHGYTEIDENTIWTDNFGSATEKECERIKEIMNEGVYL